MDSPIKINTLSKVDDTPKTQSIAARFEPRYINNKGILDNTFDSESPSRRKTTLKKSIQKSTEEGRMI